MLGSANGRSSAGAVYAALKRLTARRLLEIDRPRERAEADTEQSGATVERQRRFDVSRDGRILTERLRMAGQATPTCWSSSVNRSRRGSDRLKATARIYSRLRAKKGGRRLVRARQDADVIHEIHSDHAAIAPPELHDVSGFVVYENVSTEAV